MRIQDYLYIFCAFLFLHGTTNATLKSAQTETTAEVVPEKVSQEETISDDEATKIALEILREKSSGIPDHESIRISPWGDDIMVTLIKPLAEGSLGSDEVISVILNSKTGEFIGFLGY